MEPEDANFDCSLIVCIKFHFIRYILFVLDYNAKSGAKVVKYTALLLNDIVLGTGDRTREQKHMKNKAQGKNIIKNSEIFLKKVINYL